MFAVVGITGKVGGIVASTLLAQGEQVRAVVRTQEKGLPWASKACEVALASIDDEVAMQDALKDTEGVFLMIPPDYDPEPGFPTSHRTAAILLRVIEKIRPGKVVLLSTVGAQVREFNLLNNGGIIEDALRQSSVPTAFLRAAWFIDNAAWDLPAAKNGTIKSFLQPIDHSIPMVATQDIGAAAAALLHETWTGIRVVELEGSRTYSAADIASTFSEVLGLPVRAEAVERATWEALFREQGMKHPEARMRMLDGFNEDWLSFEGSPAERRVGSTELKEVLAGIAASSQKAGA